MIYADFLFYYFASCAMIEIGENFQAMHYLRRIFDAFSLRNTQKKCDWKWLKRWHTNQDMKKITNHSIWRIQYLKNIESFSMPYFHENALLEF